MKTFFMMLLFLGALQAADIDHTTGIWIGEDAVQWHYFDKKLAVALGDFFAGEEAESVVDFGCGTGEYIQALHQAGLRCDGFDGNPDTPTLTDGLAQVIDLTAPFDLGEQYDWVISLEVGEHIPEKFETIYIENLIRHARNGIVLTWAPVGQTGPGHCNCKNNDYVKDRLMSYGFESDDAAEKFLRQRCGIHWFCNTLMVFRRVGEANGDSKSGF